MGVQVLFEGALKGVSFEPAKTNLQEMFKLVEDHSKVGIRLEHVPDNKYDVNAIRVYLVYQGTEKDIGWIPKEDNKKLLDFGLGKLVPQFVGFNVHDNTPVGVNIIVEG